MTNGKTEIDLLTQKESLTDKDRTTLGFHMGNAHRRGQLNEWLETWIDGGIKQNWNHAYWARDFLLDSLHNWLKGKMTVNDFGATVELLDDDPMIIAAKMALKARNYKPNQSSVSVAQAFETP